MATITPPYCAKPEPIAGTVIGAWYDFPSVYKVQSLGARVADTVTLGLGVMYCLVHDEMENSTKVQQTIVRIFFIVVIYLKWVDA